MKHTILTCAHLLARHRREARCHGVEVAHGPRTSAVRSVSLGKRREVWQTAERSARRKRREGRDARAARGARRGAGGSILSDWPDAR
jgi:hypothetical protein